MIGLIQRVTRASVDIDLQQVLGQIQTVGNLTEIEIDDLVIEMRPNTPVSYTHLTLPTNREV